MLIGPAVTYSSTIWTDDRKISSVIVGVAVLWVLTLMVWRGSSVGAWLLTVFSAVGLVVNNLSWHGATSVWWVLRVVLPLIAVILMWAPRGSRSWLMRPSRMKDAWLADDASLPGGHGSVAVLMERPTGAVPRASSDEWECSTAPDHRGKD